MKHLKNDLRIDSGQNVYYNSCKKEVLLYMNKSPKKHISGPQAKIKFISRKKAEKGLKEAFKQYPRTIKALANR